MGATAGFLGELTRTSEINRQRQTDEAQQSRIALRERKADEIEKAIQGIQQRGALKPGQPGYLSPDDLKRELDEAQKQLAGLYEPHEGPALMSRIKNIFHKGKTEPSAEPQKTGIQLRPGMTLSDVLAAGAPTPEVKDNKYAELRSQLKEVLPNLSDEDLDKAVKIAAGLEPREVPEKSGRWELVTGTVDGKPVVLQHNLVTSEFTTMGGAKLDEDTLRKFIRTPLRSGSPKGLSYDKLTDEVKDNDTGKRYARDDKSNPPDVQQMFKDQKRTTDEAEQRQIRKERRLEDYRVGRQLRTIRAAFDRGDYNLARRELNKSKADLEGSLVRQQTMHANYADALQTGNQQAMLSLVANHIGMTLGAQKGARITRAAWDEAMNSAPWMDAKVAKFFHTDTNGDRIFDGWKSGVTLTKEQMDQMVQLADEKVDFLKRNITQVEEDYADDLSKPEGYGKKKKPKTEAHKFPKSVKIKGKDIPVDENGIFVLNGQKFKINPDGKGGTAVP